MFADLIFRRNFPIHHICLDYDCIDGMKKCSNGLQCIAVEFMCDGVKHCEDGSDETYSDCAGNEKTMIVSLSYPDFN